MRWALAATVLVLLVAPEASAQVAADQPARLAPVQAEIAAQATFDTGYLLALYMAQLAAAGAAPSQADIDEAARQYLTNGAAMTSVPNNGPGAAYFQNGAAVTAVPSRGPGAAYFNNGSEVLAYYPAPQVAPAAPEAVEAGASAVVSASYAEDAGVQRATTSTEEAAPQGGASAQPGPAPQVRAGPSSATGLTCSPLEIEAAMAIAREYATAAAPPPFVVSCMPSTSSPRLSPPVETAPILVHEPAPSCPPGPSPSSRVAPALGGAFLGALFIALWQQRPRRPLRVAQRRSH